MELCGTSSVIQLIWQIEHCQSMRRISSEIRLIRQIEHRRRNQYLEIRLIRRIQHLRQPSKTSVKVRVIRKNRVLPRDSTLNSANESSSVTVGLFSSVAF